VLIYLDVSYPVTLERSSLNWRKRDYQEQLRRLSHAREHANLIIETDKRTPEEILDIVLKFLKTV